MSFSKEWEEAYQKGTNLSIWPWSDLVSMFYHYFPRGEKGYSALKVLELGCGAGANIPFFYSLSIDYYTIEGSVTETEILKKRYAGSNIHIEQGDFSRKIPFFCDFDLIFDRAAVSHNETADIRRIIKKCYDLLKPGGYYFGIDWFSTNEKEYAEKLDIKKKIDDRTFRFDGDGTYANLGNVHFTDKEEILFLFADFLPSEISLKSVETYYPQKDTSYHWNFAMRKQK